MKLCLGAALLAAAGCSNARANPGAQKASDSEAGTDSSAEAVADLETELDEVTGEMIAALESLGYVQQTPTANPQDRGVVSHLPGAFDGLNLFNSRSRTTAKLTDMKGKVLHRWTFGEPDDNDAWMHVELLPNGDLMVISKDRYVARIDWDSNVVWKTGLRAHHDLIVGDDGNTYALTRRIRRYQHGEADIPILSDRIAVIDPKGKPIARSVLYPLLQEEVPQKRLDYIKSALSQQTPIEELVIPEAAGDVTHANSIEIIAKGIPGIAPPGSFLLSIRELDQIYILNPRMNRVLWSWGKRTLQGQHHATMLDNGNILLFDNGTERRQSRVLEVNPQDRRIVWSYTSPKLFSYLRGAAQKLPNGNVLITESDKGHALEVTPAGEVVWDFWNPDIIETPGERPHRAVIYRLTRYAKSYLKRTL